MNLYAIKDTKSQSWGNPWTAPSNVHALRNFQTEVNRADANNMLHQYPEEFDLYLVGNWDDQTGTLHAQEQPELLANGKKLIRER